MNRHTKEKPNGEWVLQRVPGVTSSTRICPHCLFKMLKGFRPSRANSLFWNQRTGNPVTSQWVSKMVRRQMQLAGIAPEFTAHSCRGAGATKALQQGFDERTVRKQFRWSATSTTLDRHYDGTAPDSGITAAIVAPGGSLKIQPSRRDNSETVA